MVGRIGNAFRTQSVNFPAVLPNLNVIDDGNILGRNAIANAPGWTPGATILDNVALPGQAQSQGIDVLAFSVGGYLCRSRNADLQVPPCGRFGKILAGLSTSPSTQMGNAPFASPMVPLPGDLTMIDVLWNPDTDPFPPDVSFANGQLQPIEVSHQLPFPLRLNPGSTLSVGIWMLPSLITMTHGGANPVMAGIALAVQGGQYNIVYQPAAS